MKLKYVTAVWLLMITSMTAQAQVNILEQIGVNNTSWFQGAVLEQGDNYFVTRYNIKAEADSFYLPHPFAPTQLSVWKYSKSTLQPLASAQAVVGDTNTLQIDSFNYDYRACYHHGKIHIMFKRFVPFDSLSGQYYLCYTQLDTNLNITVPQTRICSVYGWDVGTSFIGMHNDDVIYSTSYLGSNYDYLINRYYIIDTLGHLVRQDTLGYKPPVDFQISWVYNVSRYPGNRYLVTGLNLLGTSLNTWGWNFFIADSAMNVADTFMGPAPIYSSEVAVLPGGSFITSTGFWGKTQIYKWLVSRRFDSAAYVQNGAIDGNDANHPSGGIYYNTYDNKVYALNQTHKADDVDGSACGLINIQDPHPYGYTEITCLDTNINRLWRKYIKVDFRAGGSACILSGVVPDGREGISVMGEWHNSDWDGAGADTLRQFMYYITATTNTDSTIIDPITDIHHPVVEIRDRFKIYPNPATDVVWIDDIEARLQSIALCDAQGRQLLKQAAIGAKAAVDIATLPQGIYFITIVTKDEEVLRRKIVKR